ncbi:MAG: hypothetical protein LIO90_07395 [Bacteroidales bacterium]|nr:hypothetical protein [Bacteroidales bacterium]
MQRLFLFSLFGAVALATIAAPVTLRCWIDNDTANSIVTQTTTSEVDLQLDVSDVAAGLHFLNILGKGDVTTAPYRYAFLKTENLAGSTFQYWIDDQIDEVSEVTRSATQVAFNLPLSNIGEGIHYLTVCHRDRYGRSLGVNRYPFYVASFGAGNNQILGYRYTFDLEEDATSFTYANYDGKQPLVIPVPEGGTIVSSSLTFGNEDVIYYRQGNIHFAIQYQSLTGDWSPVESLDSVSDRQSVHPYRLMNVGQKDTNIAIDAGSIEALHLNIPNEGVYYLRLSQELPMRVYSDDFSLIEKVEGSDKYRLAKTQDTPDDYYVILHNNSLAEINDLTAELSQPYYFDGLNLYVSEEGQVEMAMADYDGLALVKKVIAEGPLSKADLDYFNPDNLPALEYLNLEKITVADGAFYNWTALSNSQTLMVLEMPSDITNAAFQENGLYGSNIFDNNPMLCALRWWASMDVPSVVVGGINNPNLLLYCSNSRYALDMDIQNIVVLPPGSSAGQIVLTDGYPFYCPYGFYAYSITYDHIFTMPTIIGEAAGWETISLPFDVQKIIHSENGNILPFSAGLSSASKPFWLFSMDSSGFVSSGSIKEYKPYIISMPNNEEYEDDYNLAGLVTFYSQNINIHATEPSSVYNSLADVTFVPTTLPVAQADSVYTINKTMASRAGEHAGSLFEANVRDVEPFEAYLTSNALSPLSYYSLRDLGLDVSAISDIRGDERLEVWADGLTICLRSSEPMTVSVYNVQGVTIKTATISTGTTRLEGFLPGLYIVAGHKILLQ